MKQRKQNKRLVEYRLKPLTVLQVKALLDAAQAEMKTLILMGALTGQRIGDLLALRWRDVDVEAGLISFLVAKSGRWLEVPMAPELQGYLAGLPKGEPDALVLPGLGSRPVVFVAHRFGKLAAGVGLAGVRFHSFRVTFIYRLMEKGVPEKKVKALMGYKDSESWRHLKPSIAQLRAAIKGLPQLK